MLVKIKSILLGFLVCVILAIVAQVIGHFLPTVGSALFAIILGIIFGNTLFNRPCFSAGAAFSEKNLLEYSIVLTGATLVLKDIIHLGYKGIIFIVIQMILTITIAYFIGKALGFNRKFRLLMGAGNAVCGSSAIATVSPILDANAKNKGIAITIVNLTGTILMVSLPFLTGLFYKHEMEPTCAMLGGTLQSVGQVIGGATLVGVDYVALATIYKIVRIIFIVLVALVFTRLNHEDEGSLFKKNTEKSAKIKADIPWFIIGFFIMAILHTIGVIPSVVANACHDISTQFEIIALVGIGMRVKIRDLISEGPKAMAYGICVGICQIAFAFCLIQILIR